MQIKMILHELGLRNLYFDILKHIFYLKKEYRFSYRWFLQEA